MCLKLLHNLTRLFFSSHKLSLSSHVWHLLVLFYKTSTPLFLRVLFLTQSSDWSPLTLNVYTDRDTVLTLCTKSERDPTCKHPGETVAPVQTAKISSVHRSSVHSLWSCSNSSRQAQFSPVGLIAAPISNLTRLHRGFLSPRPPDTISVSPPFTPPHPAPSPRYGSISASDSSNYSLMGRF